MVLNFVTFVGLAVLLISVARTRYPLRVVIDASLACVSVATLYAWNAMGRANPLGTGTVALVVEAAIIVLAVADVIIVLRRSRPTALRPAFA
jgi:hypothetical protein